MLGANSGTAEEFHSRCLGNARIMDAAARQHANAGDAVDAVFCAWAGDVAIIEATVWERVVVTSSTPLQRFFGTAQALTSAIAQSAGPVDVDTTAEQLLVSIRVGALAVFDGELAASVAERWSDVGYLATLPAPTFESIASSVATRLEGKSSRAYIEDRRLRSRERLLAAQELRVRGDVHAAITAAFEADFLALEAYLVESAVAASDTALATVASRYALASEAVADIPALPNDFARAVTAIRTALTTSLGEADGRRLKQALITL